MLNFSTSGRLDCIDSAKAIAIIAIIVGHTVCINDIPFLHATINSFHVPAFFIIAGFFVKDIAPRIALKKYAAQYLWPYLVTCLLVGLYGVTIRLLKGGDELPTYIPEWTLKVLWGSGLRTNVLLGDMPYIGAIWFLFALFWAKLIVTLSIRRFPLLYAASLAIALYSFAAIASRYILLPWSLLSAMEASLLLMVGYLIRRYELLERAHTMPRWLWALLIALCVANILLDNFISMVRGYMGFNIVGLFCAVIETVGIICLCDKFNLRLPWTGANTLYLLSAHLVTMPLSSTIYAKLLPHSQPPLPLFLEVVAINLTLAYSLAWLMKHFNILRCPTIAK